VLYYLSFSTSVKASLGPDGIFLYTKGIRYNINWLFILNRYGFEVAENTIAKIYLIF
jgi:hypothetical protein